MISKVELKNVATYNGEGAILDDLKKSNLEKSDEVLVKKGEE